MGRGWIDIYSVLDELTSLLKDLKDFFLSP
jgi:hypothetical protein